MKQFTTVLLLLVLFGSCKKEQTYTLPSEFNGKIGDWILVKFDYKTSAGDCRIRFNSYYVDPNKLYPLYYPIQIGTLDFMKQFNMSEIVTFNMSVRGIDTTNYGGYIELTESRRFMIPVRWE